MFYNTETNKYVYSDNKLNAETTKKPLDEIEGPLNSLVIVCMYVHTSSYCM